MNQLLSKSMSRSTEGSLRQALDRQQYLALHEEVRWLINAVLEEAAEQTRLPILAIANQQTGRVRIQKA